MGIGQDGDGVRVMSKYQPEGLTEAIRQARLRAKRDGYATTMKDGRQYVLTADLEKWRQKNRATDPVAAYIKNNPVRRKDRQ